MTGPERARVKDILAQRGERLTPQRAAVLTYVQSTDQHPDARLIYEAVVRELPQVSLGTIYRTLTVLQEVGLVRELKYGAVSRYDANIGAHDHAHCVRCGRVQDINRRHSPNLSDFEVDGFRVDSHQLEVYGICRSCQEQVLGNDSRRPEPDRGPDQPTA